VRTPAEKRERVHILKEDLQHKEKQAESSKESSLPLKKKERTQKIIGDASRHRGREGKTYFFIELLSSLP